MRIVVVASELPYPPIHGGKVDIWRRLLALKQAGASIYLITWINQFAGEQIDETTINALNSVASHVSIHPLRRVSEQPLALLRWPAFANIRAIPVASRSGELNKLKEFAPQAVFVDGLHGGLTGIGLADALATPLFYRSHNIEHRYIKAQFNRTVGTREKIVGLLNIFNMQRLEKRVMNSATKFFDISMSDLAYWKQTGFSHGEWLPPLLDDAISSQLSETAHWTPEFDIGYVGNLYSPNNVEGVLWFINNVLPKLQSWRNDIKVFIAGAKPVAAIKAATKAQRVTLIDTPPEMVPHLRNARILINPVFAGSGVNIKSVEMLFTPAALVTTPQGVQGLPDNVVKCFQLADTVEAFAAAIQTAVDTAGAASLNPERITARMSFSSAQGQQLLKTLTHAVQTAQTKSR
jgi:hypothetical protein